MCLLIVFILVGLVLFVVVVVAYWNVVKVLQFGEVASVEYEVQLRRLLAGLRWLLLGAACAAGSYVLLILRVVELGNVAIEVIATSSVTAV